VSPISTFQPPLCTKSAHARLCAYPQVYTKFRMNVISTELIRWCHVLQ
jgi:hypothetical protein